MEREADMDYFEPTGHNFAVLKRELTSLSAAKEWIDVVKEWELFDAYFYNLAAHGDAPDYGLGKCLCNHSPIVEHAVLRNRITDQMAVVGNVCVRRFISKDSVKFFDCVKRIEANIYAAPNDAVIEMMYRRDLIDQSNKAFLEKTQRLRGLNLGQRTLRKYINETLLAHVKRFSEVKKKSRKA
jgi:hypothetical protein